MTSRTLAWGTVVTALFVADGTAGAQSRAADMAAANALYAAQRYAEAVVAYQAVVAADPAFGEARFFLANALDNQYRPSRRGQPANDRLLDAAREHYEMAAALLVRPDQALLRKRTLQFLVALHGSDRLNQPDQAEQILRRLIALDPTDPATYFALAKICEDGGRLDDARAVWEQVQLAAPDRVEVWTGSAQFHNRRDEFDRCMEMLRRVTELEPANPQRFYHLAVYFEEKVRKDFRIDPARQAAYLASGLEAIERALALRPDYFEALTYKGLLLRQQARREPDAETQRRLLEQADALQRQTIAVRDARTRGTP